MLFGVPRYSTLTSKEDGSGSGRCEPRSFYCRSKSDLFNFTFRQESYFGCSHCTINDNVTHPKEIVRQTMRPSRPSVVSRSSASSQRSQRSARYAFDPLDDPRPEHFKFSRRHHLIITTAEGVYTYGSHGATEIFKSGSQGIVAAKQASNGARILAVADDQLVVLHDVHKGMRRSYRLRSADVSHCCLLPSLSLHACTG